MQYDLFTPTQCITYTVNVYREEPKREEKLDFSLEKFLARKKTQAQEEEYAGYVKLASELTKSKYFVMHKRVEKAFADRDTDFMLACLKDWVHQAEKSDNGGARFNYLFKQYRDKYVQATPVSSNL